jgi:hypothetical protein
MPDVDLNLLDHYMILNRRKAALEALSSLRILLSDLKVISLSNSYFNSYDFAIKYEYNNTAGWTGSSSSSGS